MKKYSLFSVLLVVFLLGIVGMVQADLNDGLVAYYPFNCNANDKSGNGYHGIIYGATLTDDKDGNLNNAYLLQDNAIDRVSLPYNVMNNLTDFSVTAWLSITRLSSFLG